jgi:three-Cys-motif partner protein
MTTKSACRGGGETLSNGNCTTPAPDGLPAQCVGQWAADKHYFLQQYIEATRTVRNRYRPPNGRGGAAFIDLFAGPGVVRVRESGAIRDGSPMVAFRHAEAPFTQLVLCDLAPDNVRALRARTAGDASRVTVVEGDCNERIDQVAAAIPEHGLNIALVDPFALQALKFSTLRRLAEFKRMDLVVHFPTADIKRNLCQHENTKRWLDEALGTNEWSTRISNSTDVASLIDVLKKQLGELGYQSQNVRSEPIRNNQNATLYYLVYASKSRRGDEIWQSITKNKPTGQKGWDF